MTKTEPKRRYPEALAPCEGCKLGIEACEWCIRLGGRAAEDTEGQRIEDTLTEIAEEAAENRERNRSVQRGA